MPPQGKQQPARRKDLARADNLDLINRAGNPTAASTHPQERAPADLEALAEVIPDAEIPGEDRDYFCFFLFLFFFLAGMLGFLSPACFGVK